MKWYAKQMLKTHHWAIITLFGFLMMHFTGCSTITKKTIPITNLPSTPTVYDRGIYEMDIEVGNQIKGSAVQEKVLCWTIQEPSGYAVSPSSFLSKLVSSEEARDVKTAAIYNAVTQADCDILIAPRYVIIMERPWGLRWLRSKVTVEVIGFAGTIKGVTRTLPEKESNTASAQNAKVDINIEVNKDEK